MISAPAALLALAVLGRVDPPGDRMIVCSFRTGDTELFAVDPASGDSRNLTLSPRSRSGTRPARRTAPGSPSTRTGTAPTTST